MEQYRFFTSFRMTVGRLRVAAMLVLIAAGQSVMASNWSVEYSGGKFVISRDNTTISETVNYRTVSISALEGKHYTGVNGRVTLNPGESSKNIDVAEIAFSDVPVQYRYQGTNKLYYDFEVYDDLGTRRAKMRKTITSGGTSNNQYYLNNILSYLNDENISNLTYINTGKIAAGSAHYHDTYFTPPTDNVETSGTLNGYVLIDDSYDYKYKSATVHPDYLYVTNRAGATGQWHKLVGNKLYASVVFTEKEKDD
ncbi:MAG: hypothetical protein IKZ60_00820, partial [Bacteroidales bacterium]|nr:hypothetical protein [Bacteroidales bacterium]